MGSALHANWMTETRPLMRTGHDHYSALTSKESNASKVILSSSGTAGVRRRLKSLESLQSWSTTELGNARCRPIPELEMVWQSR
jgi:hypothetical protein